MLFADMLQRQTLLLAELSQEGRPTEEVESQSPTCPDAKDERRVLSGGQGMIPGQ